MMAKVPNPQERSMPVIVQAIRDLFAGRSNAVGSVTLTESDTETTVDAINCGPESKIFLMPTTATAAAEFGGGDLYVSSVASGAFTITHANDASTDRTFFYVCLG